MPRKRTGTMFGKPKNKRLAAAISITSPTAFRKSIKRVTRMRGISPTTKKRALVLARNRAGAQLHRQNLSRKERTQFRAIKQTSLPSMKKLGAKR